MWLCVMITAQLIYVFFRCPEQCHWFNEFAGLGRCRWWWLWVWIWFIPLWVVDTVTFVKGFDYQDLTEFAVVAFNLLLEDTYHLILILAVIVLLVLLYFSRHHIYGFLGIDDRNIVHFVAMDNFKGRDARSFQVCVWRVDADQAYLRFVDRLKGQLEDCMTLQSQGQGGRQQAERQYEELLGIGQEAYNAAGQGTGSFWSSSFFGGTTLQDLEDEENTLPLVGKQCNLFVRLAYGDNEPQTSRVVRLRSKLRPQSIIAIQATFRLDMEVRDKQSLLHVEVRDQVLVGAQEPGRISFELEDIKESINRAKETTKKVKRRDAAYTGGEDPAVLEVAENQVVKMLQYPPKRGESEKFMFEAGFEPYALTHGGCIWLAFAELAPEQDVEVAHCC